MAESKVLVIYYSKTGFTKKYAEWIGESLSSDMSCDVIPYEKRKKIQLSRYDTILFGGGFHAGQINGLKWFKAQVNKLSEQSGIRVAVFATGGMPSEAPNVEQSMRQNFTEQEWEKIKTFYLPGGMCYEKMGVGDKIMMAIFRAMLKEAKVDDQMRQIVSHSYDITSKDAIAPIVEWCR